MSQTPTFYSHFDSPIGRLVLVGDDKRLSGLYFPGDRRQARMPADWVEDERPFAAARRQLQAYFDGTLTEFDVAVAPAGDDFQRSAWAELAKIPYGETVSYGEIARRMGQEASASRAVGAAMGANPVPIILPCHRVVGADGSLTGFGGGLEIKQFLLDLEFRVRPPAGTLFAAAAGSA